MPSRSSSAVNHTQIHFWVALMTYHPVSISSSASSSAFKVKVNAGSKINTKYVLVRSILQAVDFGVPFFRFVLRLVTSWLHSPTLVSPANTLFTLEVFNHHVLAIAIRLSDLYIIFANG